MPDFDFKTGQFPIASVIDASQRKVQIEQQARQHGQEQLIKGLQTIGQAGESLFQMKKRMAQALAFQQSPEVQSLLGSHPNEASVAQGPLGPVRFDQTAQGAPGMAPQQNQQVPAKMIESLLPQGDFNGIEMLSKLRKDMAPVEDIIATKDSQGNVTGFTHVPRTKGGKTLLSGPLNQRTPLPMDPGKATFKVIDTFNANPQVRRQQQSIDGAVAVRELALSENPIAASAIPTYMARASGEVGALSEADKAPFGGSAAILERLEAALTQKTVGQLSDENRQFLVELSDIMEKNDENNLDRKAREMAKQYSGQEIGLGAKDIFSKLRPERSFEEAKPLTPPSSKDVLTIGGTFHGQKIVGVKKKK